jgi:hypothetical protein
MIAAAAVKKALAGTAALTAKPAAAVTAVLGADTCADTRGLVDLKAIAAID